MLHCAIEIDIFNLTLESNTNLAIDEFNIYFMIIIMIIINAFLTRRISLCLYVGGSMRYT